MAGNRRSRPNRARSNNGQGGRNRSRVLENSFCARMLANMPSDPPQGTPSVLQRIRLVTDVPFTSGTTGTVTIAQFGAALPSSSSIEAFKIQKVMVYAPQFQVAAGTSMEQTLTVQDQLPNADGLIVRDSSTAGQSRAHCGYIPCLADRELTRVISATNAIFSWTTGSAVNFLTVVIEAWVRVQ